MASFSGESASSNALRFTKLNGDNYRSWAFNMRLFLESHDLFEHVDETAEAPNDSEDGNQAEMRIFRQRAKKAWTYICLAIEPEQQIHIRETKTAKEAWDCLKNQFARESILQKIRLRQQYYSCRFKNGGDMLAHINHLRSLHDQLREMGIEINDKELAMTLLASLPEDFKPLITALDAVGEDNVSFEKVKGMLLNDLDRRMDRPNSYLKKSDEDALAAKRSFAPNFRRANRGRNPGPKVNESKPFRGVCHFCKEQGHFARDCPKRNMKNSGDSSNASRSYNSAHCVEEDTMDEVLPQQALHASKNPVESSYYWIIDSGATQHMTFDGAALSEYVEFKQPAAITLGDNGVIYAYGKGTYHLITDVNGHAQNIALKNVLYLPHLGKNLLSVRAMTSLDAVVQFEAEECKIMRNSQVLGVGEIKGKLFILKLIAEQAHTAKENSDAQLWHCRLGHLGMENVKKLSEKNMVDGMDCTNFDGNKSLCEGCIMGKHHRMPYPKNVPDHASEVMEIIHSDVCGPMNTDSLGKTRYFVTFIDDFSRYVSIYYIKHKDEVLERFKEFVNVMSNLTGRRVKILRTDNGGEYCSKIFSEYLKEQGIFHQTTVPDNPAQNGVAERMNRTIVESARSLIHHAKMPMHFWAEAVNTAAYIRNRCPTVAIKDNTPFESIFKKKPNISNLKVFGCIAFVHIAKERRKKFEAKSQKTIFVGYPTGTKGYKLYDPSTKRFMRSRDVIFAEQQFYNFAKDTSTDFFYPVPEEIPDAVRDKETRDTAADPDNYQEHADDRLPVGATYEENFMNKVRNLDHRRPTRLPSRLIEEDSESCYIADVLTAEIDEPKNIFEAWNGDHSVHWKEATDSEHGSLQDNTTWDLVPLPKDKKAVGSRWVFKVKRNGDGSLDRYKARLVAQGYSQEKGIDYEEVFSPVVRYTAIRSLLALGNALGLEMHQMDVKTAFLQGELDTEIFMKQPPGYVDSSKPDYVCKLNKSIYGLKQAARCWNAAINKYLTSNGYQKSNADSCLYSKSIKQKNGHVDFLIMAIYVDDILLLSNSAVLLNEEKRLLGDRFKIVDQGEVHHILGMSIKRNRKDRSLHVSQPKYLEGILKRFKMLECKSVSTPLEAGRRFQKLSEDEEMVDVQQYQMMIGCLTYAATTTRADIAAAVGILAQFMAKPGKEHWEGVKRILRYIKGTLNYGLRYSAAGNEIKLSGYSDADWAGDLDTRRSTSGYVYQINGCTISWSSKRQITVAKSSTEAEYVALSTSTQEAIWLRVLLGDLGFKQRKPTVIFEDNQSSIELSKNPKFHNRTKHIDVSFHFVRERVADNSVEVKYCPTEDMAADMMTKGLTKAKFEKFRDMIGITNI